MSDMQDKRKPNGDACEKPAHLLIPMDATERSGWGIRYALQQRRAGVPMRVSLLFVAVPPDEWRVLRFKTEEELLHFQSRRGRLLMEEAAAGLQQAGIEVDYLVREGDVVFHIMDVAEQCDCDAIVLPIPYPRLFKLLSVDVSREVARRERTVPVITVNAAGMPDSNWKA